jgi:hypothetical protein
MGDLRKHVKVDAASQLSNILPKLLEAIKAKYPDDIVPAFVKIDRGNTQYHVSVCRFVLGKHEIVTEVKGTNLGVAIVKLAMTWLEKEGYVK